MTYYKMSEYTIKGYRKSKTAGKKYDAILMRKSDKKLIYVPFGAIGYETYKDTTGLGLYGVHNDKMRRKNYIARHKGFIKDSYYSPGYFSMKKLWT